MRSAMQEVATVVGPRGLQERREHRQPQGGCLYNRCRRRGYQRLRSLAIDRCGSAGLRVFSQLERVSLGALAKGAQRRFPGCP